MSALEENEIDIAINQIQMAVNAKLLSKEAGDAIERKLKMEEAEDEYISYQQAADILNCSVSSIRKLRVDGRINTINVSKTLVRIKKSEILAILSQ